MGSFRIALCQMNVTADKSANLEKAFKMIAEAKSDGADIAVLPEMFICPYDSGLFRSYAEEIHSGKSVQRLSEIAKALDITLFAGSIPELEGGKVYNTCLVFSNRGLIIGKHRKMHLFDIDIPGEITFRESDALSPGNSLTIADTPYVKAGVEICYDMRFPELSRLLVKQGAGMIVIPAAFNMVTGPAHWEITIRTRALDNQVYVCACAPARNDSASYVSYAHSMISDPWGRMINRAGTGEEMIISEINTEEISLVRSKLPLLKNLRNDIYSLSQLKE